MSYNPFSQKAPANPHMVRGTGGLKGEVADLRSDVKEAFNQLESQGGYLRTDEFTNPVVADVDALKTSIATAATARAFVDADLNGVVGGAEMVPPRNPTVTSTLHAHVTAVNVTFRGKLRDAHGRLVDHEVVVVVTNGGGATDAGADVLSIVEEIEVPAMGGASGSLEFGFGAIIGLSAKIKSRAGLIAPIRQVAVGAVVTTGTFTNPTGCLVTSYAPASAPDGTRDYAVTYEVAPS
jgi:hypothetical protein